MSASGTSTYCECPSGYTGNKCQTGNSELYTKVLSVVYSQYQKHSADRDLILHYNKPS